MSDTMTKNGAHFDPNLIFEKSNDTLSTFSFGTTDDVSEYLPKNVARETCLDMPNVSEVEIVRHFIELSGKNYGVDNGMYPLGSCTMKYNPKINERVSKFDAFNEMHPYSAIDRIQGTLEVIHECGEMLKEVTGMADLSFSPCAGAHGELTAMFIVKAYFRNKGEDRQIILVPDSAHGTNPASANVAGFKVVSVNSDADGFVDIEDLKSKANENVAAFMLTNPNTLGLYEKNIALIRDICHAKGIQLYYDGANLNAILGISRPGDTGFDLVHLNLHKSFSTPHGGGGPGCGAVGVKAHLKDFMPNYITSSKNGKYSIEHRGGLTIGQVRAFSTNFSVLVKAYTYIKALGAAGLRMSGLLALLNANYIAALLRNTFSIATKPHIMHEFVIGLDSECHQYDISIMDFAKRILDYGYHAPTVSFPLIVHNCLMIEPTETESKKRLDDFAAVLLKIYDEMKTNAQTLRDCPTLTPVKRIDDVTAARVPIVKY